MNLQMEGLCVLVTGGSKGIGAAIVEGMASEGCDIIFCSRNGKHVTDMLNKLDCYPVEKKAEVLDVTNQKEFDAWIKTIKKIDIFIPNVSAISSDWNETLNTDIYATVKNTESVIPHLCNSSHAAITYIGSKAASYGTPNIEAYGAGKAAMIHYMKSLSSRLAPKSIRANVVSPGDTLSLGGFWDKERLKNPERFQRTLNATPMRRLCLPKEVANVVVFISSPMASFVTGSNILVDGGFTQHIHG